MIHSLTFEVLVNIKVDSGGQRNFVFQIHLEKSGVGESGDFGFSIRGGAEHGIGVYVSYVDVGSLAERQGLVPGDMLVSVNGTSFHKVPHSEAVKVNGQKSVCGVYWIQKLALAQRLMLHG